MKTTKAFLILFFTSSICLFSQTQIVVDGCNGLTNQVFIQGVDVGNCPCYESSLGIVYWNIGGSGSHVYNSSLLDCSLANANTSGVMVAQGPFCDIFQNSPQGSCILRMSVPEPVPTLSEWALVFLGLSLIILGLIVARVKKLIKVNS